MNLGSYGSVKRLSATKREELLREQGGRCGACGDAITLSYEGPASSINGAAVLDHDHHTGKARSWVCVCCNVSLGIVEAGHAFVGISTDTWQEVQIAYSSHSKVFGYLERHNASITRRNPELTNLIERKKLMENERFQLRDEVSRLEFECEELDDLREKLEEKLRIALLRVREVEHNLNRERGLLLDWAQEAFMRRGFVHGETRLRWQTQEAVRHAEMLERGP